MTCFLACREAARALRRAGDGGRLVNVAARPALSPAPGMIDPSRMALGKARSGFFEASTA